MEIFGIRFVGVSSENAHKLLLALALLAIGVGLPPIKIQDGIEIKVEQKDGRV